MSPKGIANLVQIIRFAKSIYPTMYLLFGRKARSLAVTAHTKYVMTAETIMTHGVGIPHEFTHPKTGVSANICMRYIP